MKDSSLVQSIIQAATATSTWRTKWQRLTVFRESRPYRLSDRLLALRRKLQSMGVSLPFWEEVDVTKTFYGPMTYNKGKTTPLVWSTY